MLPVNYYNLPEEYCTIIDEDLEFLHFQLVLRLPLPIPDPQVVTVKPEPVIQPESDSENEDFYFLDDVNANHMPIPIPIKSEDDAQQDRDDQDENIILINSFNSDSADTFAILEAKEEPIDGEAAQIESTDNHIYPSTSAASCTHIGKLKIVAYPNGDPLSGNLEFEVSIVYLEINI